MNGAPSPILISALSRLLKPLVRLLIHHQITFPFISQLLKTLYLQVAEESFPVEGKRMTDSRLSLLTGVHRKDVRRLRYDESPAQYLESKSASLSAQVISSWLSLPEYTNDSGEPKPLHRLAAAGHPSFESLVEETSKQDLRSRSLLDDWLQKKIIEIDENDYVHLTVEAFLPTEDFDDKAHFFGHNMHDHMAASTENLLNESAPFFDRAVYYNNLQAESIKVLQEFSEQKSMQAIKDVNRKARQLQKKDRTHNGVSYRFRLGSYFYSEAQVDEPSKTAKKTQAENSHD